MICANAIHDSDNKINDNIDVILSLLDDPVSTNVRQYLKALHSVTLYKYELYDKIVDKCNNLNLSNYKSSMQELIKKDIKELLNV